MQPNSNEVNQISYGLGDTTTFVIKGQMPIGTLNFS
jgi:hypothetical protein